MENPFSILEQRLENIENSLVRLMCALEKQPKTDTDLPADTATSFSIIELAKYLGVTKSTIFRYKKNRVFPFHQVGRTIYFKKLDVDRALLSGKKKS